MAGVSLFVYLPYRAMEKLGSDTAGSEDYIFWIIIVTIFIPIIVGFILFGYYAFKGEYDNLEK